MTVKNKGKRISHSRRPGVRFRYLEAANRNYSEWRKGNLFQEKVFKFAESDLEKGRQNTGKRYYIRNGINCSRYIGQAKERKRQTEREGNTRGRSAVNRINSSPREAAWRRGGGEGGCSSRDAGKRAHSPVPSIIRFLSGRKRPSPAPAFLFIPPIAYRINIGPQSGAATSSGGLFFFYFGSDLEDIHFTQE